MEGGGERHGACSPPPPPAAPSLPPPLPTEPQAEAVLEASALPPPPPPLPPPVLAEAAEAASGSLGGGDPVERPAHLLSQVEAEAGEASGTGDGEGCEEGDAAFLPLLMDEEEAKVATLEASSHGGGRPQEAASVPVLNDDLREKIVRQVEYYFSDENLPTDKFLLKYVKKNREGFVPWKGV